MLLKSEIQISFFAVDHLRDAYTFIYAPASDNEFLLKSSLKNYIFCSFDLNKQVYASNFLARCVYACMY